jgi:hypothetical protein
VTALLTGLYLMFFPRFSTESQQIETNNPISVPRQVPPYSTKEAVFSAEAGDKIYLDLFAEQGFPPTPIWGYSISVSVRYGSQVLYSNDDYRMEETINLPQTGTYQLVVVNDNDFQVDLSSSRMLLHHPYVEHSQVSDNSLGPLGLALIVVAIVFGVASVLSLMVQQPSAAQAQ